MQYVLPIKGNRMLNEMRTNGHLGGAPAMDITGKGSVTEE